MSPAKLLFFDCDNTLVLSEDRAFESCSQLANVILEAKGLPDRYTSEQLIAEFVGQSWRGMMASLQKKYGFELLPQEIDDYVLQEEKLTNDELSRTAHACEGSKDIVRALYWDNKYQLAVVSSSAHQRIHSVLFKTGHSVFFKPENIYSAVNNLEMPSTKPDPAIYNFAMQKLGVKPDECIAVEDSKAGATAAIRANVPCIAYVGAYQTKEKKEQVANMLIELGCKAVMYHWSQYLNLVNQIEQSQTVKY